MKIHRCPSPDCDFQSHSLDGVASHYVQKSDGSHDEWSEKWRLKAHLDGLDGDPGGDDLDVEEPEPEPEPNDMEFDTPEWPEPEPEPETRGPPESPGGPSCCGSPRLVGSGGDVFRLADGSAVRLESGEQICENCDEIHE